MVQEGEPFRGPLRPRPVTKGFQPQSKPPVYTGGFDCSYVTKMSHKYTKVYNPAQQIQINYVLNNENNNSTQFKTTFENNAHDFS